MDFKMTVVSPTLRGYNDNCDAFRKLEFPKLEFQHDSLAWSYRVGAGGPEDEALRTQVQEYNTYVSKLEEVDGFMQRFAQAGYCLTKQEITDMWSSEFANYVFSFHSPVFVTGLEVIGDTLLAPCANPQCEVALADEVISFAVSDNSDSYPRENVAHTRKYLWNWYDSDIRDITAYLWEILWDYDLIPEFDDEDTAPDYGDYEAYDQARDDMEEPHKNLLECFQILIDAGYATTYRIESVELKPWLMLRGKKDGSIELAVVDLSFLQDSGIVARLEETLSL